MSTPPPIPPHILGLTRYLVFNNNNGGSSQAIEVELNLTAMTFTRRWMYTPSPAIRTMVMGDVQRMDNGNTIIGFSTSGALHEVDANGMLIESWAWPAGGSFGYIEKRKELYGKPLK